MNPRCRSCTAAYLREWKAANPDTVEAYQAARRVGVHALVCANPDCGRELAARKGNARTRAARDM